MAEEITRRGGDYVLALKGNQGLLLADAERLIAGRPTAKAALAVTEEVSHGRLERRAARVVRAPGLKWIALLPGGKAPTQPIVP